MPKRVLVVAFAEARKARHVRIIIQEGSASPPKHLASSIRSEKRSWSLSFESKAKKDLEFVRSANAIYLSRFFSISKPSMGILTMLRSNDSPLTVGSKKNAMTLNTKNHNE
jgi:hypothetical protein